MTLQYARTFGHIRSIIATKLPFDNMTDGFDFRYDLSMIWAWLSTNDFTARLPKKLLVLQKITAFPSIFHQIGMRFVVSPANLVSLDWPTSEEVEGALWNLKTPRSRRNPKERSRGKCNSSNLKSSCNLRKFEAKHIIKHFYSACKSNVNIEKNTHVLHVNTASNFVEIIYPTYFLTYFRTSLWYINSNPIPSMGLVYLPNIYHKNPPFIVVNIPFRPMDGMGLDELLLWVWCCAAGRATLEAILSGSVVGGSCSHRSFHNLLVVPKSSHWKIHLGAHQFFTENLWHNPKFGVFFFREAYGLPSNEGMDFVVHGFFKKRFLKNAF